ncbi:hypothetical protein [Rhodoferax sp.]|uniref:hypothetical protein n=1 Tax=Rhodoferax sp. TaxID=50421 RepID=UPI0027642E5B|nr:hypothetical protein [Rhodoferax sp.]
MLRLTCLVFSLLFGVALHASPTWQFERPDLPANKPQLLRWQTTILRIELTNGPVAGTNGEPPTVTLRVLEVLRRGGDLLAETPGDLVATWLSDPAGGDNWKAHSNRDTLHIWKAKPSVSPPAGTKALVFANIGGSPTMLRSDHLFPDTEANRQTVLAGAAKEPFLSRLSGAMFVAIVFFPLIALGLVYAYPLTAITLAFTIWPIYWVYESQVPYGSQFRVDMIPILGGMVGSGLVLLIARLLAFRRNLKETPGTH